MNTEDVNNWLESNQSYLVTHLARVRRLLERHHESVSNKEAAAKTTGTDVHSGPAAPVVIAREDLHEAAEENAGATTPLPASLERLCLLFSLSPFERDLLLLCAGVELDSSFAAVCSAAQGDAHRRLPTFSLALAALPDAHWSALSPAAPLRRWRLIEVGSGESLTLSPLRVDERILHYLTGVNYLDDRLHGLVKPCAMAKDLPSSHRALAARIIHLWAGGSQETAQPPAIQLCGCERATRSAVAAAACAQLGVQLYTMRALDVPVSVAERETLARLWERESAITGGALLIDCHDLDQAANKPSVFAFLESLYGLRLISSAESLYIEGCRSIRLDVYKPSTQEQYLLWESALGDAAKKLNGQFEQLIAQFHLGAEDIESVGSQILSAGPSENTRELGARLWSACRLQARARLDDLAQRIEPAATWEDLVLPEQQKRMLHEIAVHLRQRTKVYESWGFAAKGARGLGISALFSGPSGTGKTMAAEVLAGELQLDLYRIDLSRVVSKYIGETEKNLRRVFDAAEGSGAILLFDEADALYGKRSEVKDSHDRYANIEVSYLLQRMEAYRGLAILTTNMKEALDPAFMRRIRFVVKFPFPNAEQRAEIWEHIFPAETPTEAIDSKCLAQMNITGGNIRNIALNAAFLAAETGEPVKMPNLLCAARSEYAKLDKPLTGNETKGWG